jgi:hypothetical protein
MRTRDLGLYEEGQMREMGDLHQGEVPLGIILE